MNTHYAIASVLTAVISLTVGSLVLLKNKKSPVNRSYFFLTLSTAAWAAGIYFHGEVYDKILCLFWGRFSHVGASFIPILFFQFIVNFLNLRQKKILKIGYIFAILFSILAFHPKFFTSVSPKASLRQWADPGSLYPVFILFFSILPIYALYTILKTYPNLSSYRKNQVKYIILASASGFVGGSTTFLTVYGIQIHLVHPYALYLVSLYNVIITYAVLKYRLMDIDIVFKKGTVYAFLTFLTLIPCMLIIVFAQRSFFGEVNYTFSWLIFGLLLLAAFLFTKIKSRAEESVERTLFREKYEYKRILREFSKSLVSFLDEQDLLNNMAHALTEVLGVDKISLILFDKEKKIYRARASRNLDDHKIMELSFPRNDPFFGWLKERREIAVREELERVIDNPKINPMIERLKFMESEVCIPLLAKHELIGIVNLGNKISRSMYSHEDIELLNYFASQAAIALENARLYEDLKKSKLIIRRADKLASLGTLSAGLAHEIKNPLVAIKTFVQLLPERFEDEEFRNYFFNVASGEVDRLSDLINTLLDFARPSEPSFQMGNINEIMNKVILLIENEAKRKNLKIKRHYSSDVPEVMLDPEQIKQVFLNIILNAAEATPENGFLTVETRRLDKDRGREFVQVEVRDTGRGISKENLERIFEPFFSTKDGGSGLGLAVSHHIVQEHQGYIEVESEVGRGTSFFINLPVNPLVMPRKEEKDRFWSLI